MAASMCRSCLYISKLNFREILSLNKFKPCLCSKHSLHLSQRYASSESISTTEYCINLVRRFDHENYLCTLLLPSESRSASFAIRAFNVEIAQIRDSVTNTDIGLMRIQFWKDSLEKIFQGKPPQQPVALEIARILNKHKLSKTWFNRMLQSRAEGLSDRPFQTLEDLEVYAENTVSSINYLLLESSGIKNVDADHIGSHLGKAQGIATLIRGVPFNAQKRRVYLPQDIMIKHQVSQEEIVRNRKEQKIKDVIFEIASLAHTHLQTARSLRKDSSKAVTNLFLPAVACEAYLNSLAKVDFDVFHPSLQLRNHKLPMLLLWRKLRNTF